MILRNARLGRPEGTLLGRRAVRLFAVVIASQILGLSATPPRAQAASAEENQLKAAYLFQFTRFVTWPANAFPQPDSPFRICLVGADAMRDAADATAGRTVNGHRIVLSDRNPDAGFSDCHVLFIGTAALAHWVDIRDRVAKRAVLTVGDADGFVDRGGILGLVVMDGRIRFSANLAVARKSGLHLDFRLLRLAVTVRE